MATRSTALSLLLTLSALACGGDAQPGDTIEVDPPGDTDTVAEVDTTTPETDVAVDPDTTTPDAETSTPDADTTGPDADTAEPDADTAEPDADTTSPLDTEVSPPTVEAVIGPTGGELELEGARLIVPQGALAEATEIRLVRTDLPIPAGYNGYSARWRFEPAGLEFATPARVELPFEGQPSRASIFWSNRDGIGHAWRPTAVIDLRAVAHIDHFSDGFVGDGSDYEEAVDATCVRTRVLHGRKVDPSGIGLFFGVEDCEGRPVRDLPQAAFRVIEGGGGLGAEAQATLLPKPGQLALVSLVLDLSASSDAFRPQLIAAARRFVTTLHERLPGRVVISVEYFAAMVDSVHTGRYTVDLAETLAALTTLETLAVSQPNGINLHGALMNALARAETARTTRHSRSAGGALMTSHVVVFTDSDDTTKKFTAAEVQAAVLASPTHVVGVGLRGPDYDPEALAALAPDGLFEATSQEGLELAFAGAMNRVVGQSEATYFLAYCTPTVAGEHEVHLEVREAELESSRGWTFTASAAGQSCTADRFLDACSGFECGGFACGMCDERVERCDWNSGQCSSLCEVEGQCGDTTYVNAYGYVATCPDSETHALCGQSSCQSLRHSEEHCGICGNACQENAFCSSGVCKCHFGYDDCGEGFCRYVGEDEANCGECGNVCAVGASCESGECECPTGARVCDGACRFTKRDLEHCGACGNVCAAGATCNNGACQCPTNQEVCSGACTATQTDPDHCGECGRTCDLGCDGGSCLVVSDIELGADHSCTRTQSGVFCWGYNEWYMLGVYGDSRSNPVKGPDIAFTQLGVGHVHNCGLRSDGNVACWGSNGSRQLARAIVTSSPTATNVANLSGVTRLWVGGNSTCAGKADGKVFCWGSNSKGQLAWPTLGSLSAATEIPALAGAKHIAIHSEHSCAIMADDSVSCVGNNTYGQIGLSGVTQSSTLNPIAGMTNVTAVATGRDFSCALKSGEVYCWGRNHRGQLGDNGPFIDRSTASRVVGLADVTEIHLGGTIACAATSEGAVWCWGENSLVFGVSDASQAAPIPAIGPFVELAVGWNHLCLRRPTGIVACWGRNSFGQLGTGNTTHSTVPLEVVWQ